MHRHRATVGMILSAVFIAGLLSAAASLRSAITGVAKMLEALRGEFKLSRTNKGIFAALPLIALGVLTSFGAMLARKYRLSRALFEALLAAASRAALRSVRSVSVPQSRHRSFRHWYCLQHRSAYMRVQA